MDGFFSASVVAGKNPRVPSLPACGACKLLDRCETPKFPVQGKGGKRILVVLDKPSLVADRTGDSFAGDAGEDLLALFKLYGIDLKEDCWITYATVCRSGNKKEERANCSHVKHCGPLLSGVIKKLQPHVIVPMGPLAIHGVVRLSWTESVEETERFTGFQIPSEKLNAWICPMLSLDEINRTPEYKRTIPKLVLRKHMRAMSKKVGKGVPYPDGLVDWKSMVQIVEDPDRAAKLVDAIPEDRATCLDYENNGLKPEHQGMKMYTCAILIANKDNSAIEKVIAYPLRGDSIRATSAFLERNNPKIIANMKYERRWSVKHLESTINNVVFDTMLGAHVLDNRKGTKSVKFLIYVLFGWPLYNEHIEPFLHGTANPEVNRHINRIAEIDRRQLLLYNGLDDVAEWLVAGYEIPRIFGIPMSDFLNSKSPTNE